MVTSSATDQQFMQRAMGNSSAVPYRTSPNPCVGAVLVATDGQAFDGATEPPGQRHAERVALDAAGVLSAGGTMYTTLEPCSHTGRTGPCTNALLEAGVSRVVVGLLDPDPNVAGSGIAQLQDAGVVVTVGVEAQAVQQQLQAYLKHRTTGRPYVVLKLAATMDGRTAAPDKGSQWITGSEARTDTHRLRAQSDAILVGAGTVRADNPSLTVRHVDGADPLRVVLGAASADAKVHPCLEVSGNLGDVLDQLGEQGILQLMVEGGATVAGAFHQAGLVDCYQLYLAPALFGGDDAVPLFAGPGAPTMDELWRGKVSEVQQLGDDVRITLLA